MPKVKGKTIISASRDVPVADPQQHMTCQKFSSAEASYGAIIQSLGTCHTRAVQKKKQDWVLVAVLPVISCNLEQLTPALQFPHLQTMANSICLLQHGHLASYCKELRVILCH